MQPQPTGGLEMPATHETPSFDLALSKAIVDQASDAIIFADRDGLIRVWNGGAERIFGYKASEVIGAGLDVIIPERLSQAHHKGFNHAMAVDQLKYADKVLTTRSMHKNGNKLYVDMSFALVHDAQGNILGAQAIARDVTERFANESAQRARIAELERAVQEKPARTPGAECGAAGGARSEPA
jgi:PAS domain S-box-containing protein